MNVNATIFERAYPLGSGRDFPATINTTVTDQIFKGGEFRRVALVVSAQFSSGDTVVAGIDFASFDDDGNNPIVLSTVLENETFNIARPLRAVIEYDMDKLGDQSRQKFGFRIRTGGEVAGSTAGHTMTIAMDPLHRPLKDATLQSFSDQYETIIVP